jgi:hypothetical protein
VMRKPGGDRHLEPTPRQAGRQLACHDRGGMDLGREDLRRDENPWCLLHRTMLHT